MKEATSSQKPSHLLDENENLMLFDLIGNRCMTTATAVVQLYLSQKPDESKWNKICTGVATFIKDNVNRSYYIRIYDIVNRTMVWQQELYNEFVYKESRQFFHTFESDKGVAGLNFADMEEAREFKQTVVAKLEQRWARIAGRKLTQESKIQPNNTTKTVSSKDGSSSQPFVMESNTEVKNINNANTKHKTHLMKGKISKLDIGTPCTDFRVLSTISCDGENGYAMKNIDPDMKQLFELVGVKPELNKKTVDFIYNFVESNGGMGELKRQMSKRPPRPKPPVINAPKTSSQGKQPILSDIKVRKKAPPVPTLPKIYSPCAVSSDNVHLSAVPPSPPPPPPPLLPSKHESEAVIPSSPKANKQQLSLPVDDTRAKLMESIRKFSKSEDRPYDGTTEYSYRPSLGQLKRVEINERMMRPSVDEDTGMIGALARALHEINIAVKDSDDEDVEDESYDFWSD